MRAATVTSAEFSCDAFGVEEVLIINERGAAAESAAPHKQELSQLQLRASASYVPGDRPVVCACARIDWLCSAAQWVPRRMFATSGATRYRD